MIILTLVAFHVSDRDSKIVVHLLVFWLDLEEKTIEIGTQSGVFCCLDTHLRGTTSRVNLGGQFYQKSYIVLGPIFAPFSKNVQCVFEILFWKVHKSCLGHF